PRVCYNARMSIETKIIKIGNSQGIILSKEVLAKLRLAVGDKVFLPEQPGGYGIRAHDPDFVEAMKAAEAIMREDRDILAVLAT
ncbi:AbrB/MazE/SpoVT family DNA-binding domain-containing protein, partial [Clostridium perfringens]